MDKYAGESTISSSEKVRTEVEENDDEDEDSGKEEEDNEEDESEDEEEEQQLYDIKLSKNSLVKEPWTHGEDMDLKRLVEGNTISVSFSKTLHRIVVCVIRKQCYLLVFLRPLRPSRDSV